MAERLIQLDKSVIPAADVSTEHYERLLDATSNVQGIEAIKIGFSLGYRMGLANAVEHAHEVGLKVIFDHQKAGTDIPDTGKEFAAVMGESDVDAAIIFPQSGPVTGEAWIKALQDKGVYAIVGGEMTHPGYKRSEGGFIADEALMEMYKLGAENGVTSFVVPGNRAERVGIYKQALDEILGEGNYDLMSPGFIIQGGDFPTYIAVAGSRFHGIVGRGIYAEDDMQAAAIAMTSKLR